MTISRTISVLFVAMIVFVIGASKVMDFVTHSVELDFARKSAGQWGENFLAESAGLERLISGKNMLPGDAKSLDDAIKRNEIVDFAFYDRTSECRFASSCGDWQDRVTILSVVRDKKPVFTIKAGDSKQPNSEHTDGYAYLPILKNGIITGVFMVAVDLAWQAQTIRKELARIIHRGIGFEHGRR